MAFSSLSIISGCTCDAPWQAVDPATPDFTVRRVGRAGCYCQPAPKLDELCAVTWDHGSDLDRALLVARSCVVGSREEARELDRLVYARFPADVVRAHQRREYLAKAREVVLYELDGRVEQRAAQLAEDYAEVSAELAPEVEALWAERRARRSGR